VSSASIHIFESVEIEVVDGLIEIPETSWVHGGTPDESRIVPWAVQSIDYEDIDFWQGRINGDLGDRAVAALVEELQWYG